MATVNLANTGRVTADFFTASYRFSATVLVYKRRLVDVLSDVITDYLELVDIYVSRINAPGDIVATYPKGSIVKDEINFIMLSSESEGKSQERFYAIRENLPVFISIPSFEIAGSIQWGRQDLDIKKLMGSDTQKFLPVLDLIATNSTFPKVNFQGPLALINKSKIQVLCTGNRD
jgi:hypothetical protein